MTIEQDPAAQTGEPEVTEPAGNGPGSPQNGTEPGAELVDARARIAALEAALARQSAAAAHGVPADLLTGTTPEELGASAAALLAFAAARRPPDFGAGDRGDGPPPDPDPIRSALRPRR